MENAIHARKKIYHILNKIIASDFKSFLMKAFFTLNPTSQFLDNWHIALIIEHLQAIEDGKINRLIINMTPRALKSICVNVAWSAWLLAKNPTQRIISASYSQALSKKHSQDTRTIMNTTWYKNIFPETQISKDCNTQNKFLTTKHGFRLACSTDGTLTGEGGDVIILDDPMSPKVAISEKLRNKTINWFENTLYSRLNDKKSGAIVIVMQRLHQKDLSGFLLEKSTAWTHLKIPAIAEEDSEIKYGSSSFYRKKGDVLNHTKETKETMDMIQKELGSYSYLAQYQQDPIMMESGIIKSEWLNRYKELPSVIGTYQSWDFAIKSGEQHDYSVCTTWGVYNDQYYLIDVLRGRFEYQKAQKMVLEQYNRFLPYAVLIEDKAAGQQIIQELNGTQINIVEIIPKHDKLTRLILISSFFESGRVLLPEYKSWLAAFEHELLSFPNCKNDDQADSMSQFLQWIKDFEWKNKERYKLSRL